MDEVHYLADRFRGAGLGGGDHLAGRLGPGGGAVGDGQQRRGVRRLARARCAATVEVVVTERRPVPLFQHVMVGRPACCDLFAGGRGREPGAGAARQGGVPAAARRQPASARTLGQRTARPAYGSGRYGGGASRQRGRRQPSPGAAPRRRPSSDSTAEGLLPAIFFIFSPAGLRHRGRPADGLRDPADHRRRARRAGRDRRRAHRRAERRRPGARSTTTGSWPRSATASPPTTPGCCRPSRRRSRRRSPPAWSRSCSPPRPSRWASTCRRAASCSRSSSSTTARPTPTSPPGEYTQLTGRAGRRGIDVEGHAVVCWQPGLDPRAVAGLASRRTYPLRSSFQPTYNMAVNLVATVGRERARGAAGAVVRAVPVRPFGGGAGTQHRRATTHGSPRTGRPRPCDRGRRGGVRPAQGEDLGGGGRGGPQPASRSPRRGDRGAC